jgi:hypothetical protein
MPHVKRLDREIIVTPAEGEEILELRPDAEVRFKRVLKKKPFFALVDAIQAAGDVFTAGGAPDMQRMAVGLEVALPAIAACITGWNWRDLDTDAALTPDATTLTEELSPLLEQVWLISAASEAYFSEKN